MKFVCIRAEDVVSWDSRKLMGCRERHEASLVGWGQISLGYCFEKRFHKVAVETSRKSIKISIGDCKLQFKLCMLLDRFIAMQEVNVLTTGRSESSRSPGEQSFVVKSPSPPSGLGRTSTHVGVSSERFSRLSTKVRKLSSFLSKRRTSSSPKLTLKG
jgi:hypothetical protein